MNEHSVERSNDAGIRARSGLLPTFLLLTFLATIGLLAASPVFASTKSQTQRIVLPNHLIILIFEEHSLPTVEFRMLIDAGSWRDPAGKEGLANLAVKGLLLGTAKLSSSDFDEAVDFMGSTMETSCTKDFSTVSLETLKSRMDEGAALLAETLMEPAFPAKELKKEADKIWGEISSEEDDPLDTAQKAFEKALFLNGPYAHPVKGSKETLQGMTREDVVDFHRSFYHPNASILAIGGDVTRQEVMDRIVPLFSAWPEMKIPETSFDASFAKKGTTVTIDRPVAQAAIVLGGIGVERKNRDFYALEVMNHILGGGNFSSRLMESIRVKRGLAYSVSSFFTTRRHPGSFQIQVQTKNASAREATALAIEQMKKLQREPVSKGELETAKDFLIESFPRKFGTQREAVEFLTQTEYYGLGENYPDKYEEWIDAVTVEDVLRVAKTYLHPDEAVIAEVANTQEAGMK